MKFEDVSQISIKIKMKYIKLKILNTWNLQKKIFYQ